MATKPHTPSRRAIIGAITACTVALPLAAVTVATAAQSPNTVDWDTALIRYNVARVAWAHHPYGQMPTDHPGYAEAERAEHEASEACAAAMMHLVATPAPHFEALIEKFQICAREKIWGWTAANGAEVMTTNVIADLRRLGGEVRHG